MVDFVRKAGELAKPPDNETTCSDLTEWPASYPTVLVGAQSEELRKLLTDKLRKDDFLVLEADSPASVLDAVIRHSRPINILFLAADMAEPEFPLLLQQFRPYMRIFLVTTCPEAHHNALPPDYALVVARELLLPLKPKR